MKTETKVFIGIGILTLAVIAGGIALFNKNIGPTQNADYSKYIQTGLTLDQTKVARVENPKVTGAPNASSTGATTTKIYMTEFLDYECPACATNGEALTQALLAEYGDRLTITRKIFPIHGQGSFDVGRLVLASQIFGGDVYQNVHAKVFETQSQWAILGKKDRDEFLKKEMIALGIDYDKLLAESQNKKYDEQISQDQQDARDLGITATPSFIIGTHTRITGGLPLDTMKQYVDTK